MRSLLRLTGFAPQVTLEGANNLQDKDVNGKSDPYAFLSLVRLTSRG